MASTFLGLNTSKLGVISHQTYLNTVGHNIANTETDGYSRQQVTGVTTPSVDFYGSSGKYYVGTGTNISSVSRVRDFLLDRQLWKQNSTNSYYSNLYNVQSAMETIFTEPSDSNVQSMLDNFWTCVQNVAANPADSAARATMRQAAVDLVDIIQSCTTQLGEKVVDINDSLMKSVDRINQLTTQILALNKQITNMEATGVMANDLRDARDLLVDELSAFGKVMVYEDNMGNYTINFNGQTVVDAVTTTKLEVYLDQNTEIYQRYGYQTLAVRTMTVPPMALSLTDGSIAGLIEARDSKTQGVLSQLDMLNDVAKSLLCDFNQIHKEGLGLDNTTGLNFFGEQNIQYAALYGGTNIINGDTLVSDIGFDPESYGANNTEKNWIYYLKVNDVFFDSESGLDRIAAKTLAENLEIVSSLTNRVKEVVNLTTGDNNVKFLEDNLIFKGLSEQQILVEIVDVQDGLVTEIRYAFWDGVTPPTASDWINVTDDCTGDTGTSVIRLRGDVPCEYDIKISIDPATTAIGDEYNLTVYPTTIGSANLVNTAYTVHESKNQYTYTLINKTSPASDRVTGLVLSFTGEDDVATNIYPAGLPRVSPTGDGMIFTFVGQLPDGSDFAFEIEIKDDPGNVAGDQYSFKMPPSESASDNAVRLAQFLKFGALDDSVTSASMYMTNGQYRDALNGKSIDGQYNESLSSLGVQTQTSYSMWANQSTMLLQLTSKRSNYSDVSLDEELTNMIMFQKGYNSNARMLTTMDDMLDKLINGTGRVGL